MKIAQSVGEILGEHVTLEVESLDRLYLNVYVPQLQYAGGVAAFLKTQRGAQVVSTALVKPMTAAFVAGIKTFAQQQGIPVVQFRKGQRKDDLAKEYLARFTGVEGVLFIGVAQERARLPRTESRHAAETGVRYPWVVETTGYVNYYYIYAVDAEVGPFFLKLCSYFPYNGKLCLNGHEYLKRQLTQAGIAFEALDNGILRCADPARLQAMADGFDEQVIDALLRRWLARLPHPFTAADRAAGYRYALSLLQVECSLTQVLDRPMHGRLLFEQIIREHLDLGRPSQVQLIFERRVTKRTPGRFRTRVITAGVTPSLHVDYKHSRLKQYHKDGQALRTETTINDPADFALGKGLRNLPALRARGFAANRRLLDVECLSQDCLVGEAALERVSSPQVVDGQRVAGLPLFQPGVQALFQALVLFCLLPAGFANKDLRPLLAHLLGLEPSKVSPGQMTYHLRRLRLHGLITRLPHTHRYQATAEGLRLALFLTRLQARVLRPGSTAILPEVATTDTILRPAFDRLDRAITQFLQEARLAA
jgi:DNA-binding PadR family transcriptional regulator